MLDIRPAEAVDEAVIHFLESLERGLPTYRLVTSEHPQAEPRPPRRGA